MHTCTVEKEKKLIVTLLVFHKEGKKMDYKGEIPQHFLKSFLLSVIHPAELVLTNEICVLLKGKYFHLINFYCITKFYSVA